MPICILSVRKLVLLEDCSKGYGPFFSMLHRRIAEESLTMAGPPMTIYHSSEYFCKEKLMDNDRFIYLY